MGTPIEMKTILLVVVVPESSNLTAEDEQKRLSYLKKVIVPALWAHQSAAFLREVSVVKPKEFSVDLMMIQTKLNKNKYITSSDSFKDLKTLFEESQKSQTPDIKKAGMTLLDHYNDKMRGFEKRCSEIEKKSDPTSNGTAMEVDKKEGEQTCSMCTFFNNNTAKNCEICGNDLSCGKNSSTQPSDAVPPQNPILNSPAVWNCPECTFTNSPQQMVCEICNTPRNILGNDLSCGKNSSTQPSDAVPPQNPILSSAPVWNCPECTFTNNAQQMVCEICNTPKNILDLLKTELDQCHDLISEINKAKEVGEVAYPSNWSGTPTNDKGDLRMIELKVTDLDYTFVDDWTKGKLKELQFTLKSVKRVENWEMYQVYAQKRLAMERKNGKTFENERWLFHGTSEDCIDGICRYGFNRSYAGKNGTAFGRGVYFSSMLVTSATFAVANRSGIHKILLCRVLTGHYTQGLAKMIDAPMKSKTEKFDSVVNHVSSPTTFVIFTDYQAYPAFEISY